MNNDEYLKYLNNQFEESVAENIRWEKLYNELLEENEALREQFKKAKEVIVYYANPENWDFEEIDKSDVEFCEDPQAKLGGKRARDFLLKLEGKCKIIE